MTILIHPGFHKTGTSWLQRHLFSDRRVFHTIMSHVEADAMFVRPHDLDFDFRSIQPILDDKIARADGRIPVLSSETLSGLIFNGSPESAAVAQRLRDSFASARILFTVRAAPAAVRSMYIQYLKRGGRLSIGEFLNYSPQPGYGWFNHDVVCFDKLIAHYAQLFGEDNILVLPQELLATDQSRFVQLLVEFAARNTNVAVPAITAGSEGVSPPASGLWLLRAGNLFHRGPVNPNALRDMIGLGRALRALGYRWRFGESSARGALDNTIKAWLGNQCQRTNERLQAYCPISLRDFGYEMNDGTLGSLAEP